MGQSQRNTRIRGKLEIASEEVGSFPLEWDVPLLRLSELRTSALEEDEGFRSIGASAAIPPNEDKEYAKRRCRPRRNTVRKPS